MRLLGGVDNNITEGDGEERKGNEEEISKDEIKEAIKKIKEEKATGIESRERHGSMEERRQWNGRGLFATEYRRKKDGRKNGKRV